MIFLQQLINVVTATSMFFLYITTTAAAFTVTLTTQPHSLFLSHRNYYRFARRNRMYSSLYMSTNNFMDRLPNESDDAYFRRIVAAASNPQSFENAVLKPQNHKTIAAHPISNSTETSGTTNSTGGSKYVRAEVWEEQERERAKSSSNWEERVQFDGQVHGNRFNQNEILRHHLKGF